MQKNNKEEQLIKNTGIIAIGTIGSKLFSFFLLPLYTTALSTEEYGIVDVLQSITSLIMPFVSLELSTGVFRYLIEKKEDDHKRVITSTLSIEIINIIIFMIIVIAINNYHPIRYCGLFIYYFSMLAMFTFCQNVTRGLGHNSLYSIMSFIVTFVSLISNIILILGFNKGGGSILLSAGISYFAGSVFSIVKQSLWRYLDFRIFSKEVLFEILSYSLPLIPNAISWWIANASDRIIVKHFLGVSYNGIYAAANKVPAIYVTLYNIYNMAWIEALARGVNDSDHADFINKMFKKSIQLFGCVCIGIICGISIFFPVLIGSKFMGSYWHIYILLIAIFINSLCSMLGGIFTSYKRSDIIGKTTVMGAAVNLLVHILLVRYIGLFAASVSTLISYIVIMFARYRGVNKYVALKWPINYLFQLVIMLMLTSIGYYFRIKTVNIPILAFVILWSIYVNRELLIQLGEYIKNRKSAEKNEI